MCFSATASFGAGVILSTIGIAAIKKAQTRNEMVFASIPLIFSVQQFSEGVLWLAFLNPGLTSLQTGMTYVFLFFAQIVWPLWVPLAILLLEKEKRSKRTLRVLVAIGIVVSGYLAFCLLNYPVQASVLGRHISYSQKYPAALSAYGGGLYILATIVPPFFSSVKKMWTLSTAIAISYVMTAIFYTDYIISVWCFFASVISIAVLGLMFEIRKSERRRNVLAH